MNYINYYLSAFKKYAVFVGRASRAEYWYFFLFNLIFSVGLNTIGNNSLKNIYSLVVLIPSLAVGVRRMHDINKSGWFILIPIYNIILLATRGKKGNNKYGPTPKKETN